MAGPGPITTRNVGADSQRVHEEDVMDQVFDLEPDETPVVSTIPRSGATWRDLTWLVKFNLPQRQIDTSSVGQTSTPPYDNIVKESTPDWERNRVTFAVRARVENFVENFRYDLEVGGLASAVDPIGVQDEYALQVQDGSRQIARDLEIRILEDAFVLTTITGVGGQGATDPSQMKPLSQLVAVGNDLTDVTYTVNRYALKDLGTMAATGGEETTVWDGLGQPDATGNVELTEERLTKLMEIMAGHKFDPGISPDTLVLSGGPYGYIAGFGGAGADYLPAQTINTPAELGKITRVLQFYRTQFGILTVIWTKWIDQATNASGASAFNRDTNKGIAYMYARSFLQLAFLRDFHHEPLPPQGDHTIGMVLGDCSLKLLHPKAAMMIVGVNNVPNG